MSIGSAPAPVPTGSTVAFTDCGAACHGTIDGAAYAIVLPRQWNGTLLIYSHGYRFASPGPPDFTPDPTGPVVSPADNDGSGHDTVSRHLLGEGYALAGSAYRSRGWAVADGVRAGRQLFERFTALVARPQRTYVWGESMGGLITEVLAERQRWVSAAAPMCGVLDGPVPNFDLALEAASAVRTLLDPALQLTGYRSAAQADDVWRQASGIVDRAAADTVHGGLAKVLFIAALIGAPVRTENYDGRDLASRGKAAAEDLAIELAFGITSRYEIEQRFGGNASSTVGVDYRYRLTRGQQALIVRAGGDPRAYAAAVQGARRTVASSKVRSALAASGTPTGRLRVPTLTLHTVYDPDALVANEGAFAGRVRAFRLGRRLTQLYIAPPSTRYSRPTPYGAGHCAFTDGQLSATIDSLDRWVRTGHRPLPGELVRRFGPGLDVGFHPPGWPVR